MKRKKILKWFEIFFAAMLVFTFLSRAADSVSVAKIHASAPQNQIISHIVSGTGKIEGTRECAVFVPEGLKIAQVYVKPGESIKKEQAILTVLENSIQDSIQKKQDEIQELSLKISDIQSQKGINDQKKQNETKRAQEDLDTAVSNGNINISNAQNEVNIAQQRLNEYRARRAAEEAARQQEQQNGEPDFGDGTDGQGNDLTDGTQGNSEADRQQEQALIDDVRAKTEALNQVIMNRNREVKEADRAKQDAAIPQVQDSTEETLQTQLERRNAELRELNVLLDNKGEVFSPSEGVMKTVSAQTGGQTSQEAAAVVYELTGELSMTGRITREDMEYVSVGAAVKLEGVSKTVVENAVVQAVREDEAEPGTFVMTVAVPESGLSVGESVEFTVEQSSGPYSCCVPLTALYGQSGQEYVFVVDTVDSILGEVQMARKVSVQVKEKNQTTAALAEGTISSSQKVITEANREIQDGSRVRLQQS